MITWHLPCLGVATDSHERKQSHGDGVDPAQDHDPDSSAETESTVQVDGIGNGVPSLDRDHGQGEDGQFTGQDCKEAGDTASVS